MEITLRPVTDDDLPLLLARRRRGPDDDAYNWFGYRDWEKPRITEDSGTLIVVADGADAGDVGWHPAHYGIPPWSTAFDIGISLAPEFRGRGIGGPAQRLLATYLFDHTTANRVQASTDVANVAEQRALEKAGFTREGVLRGAQWRGGGWHDLVSYSLLRGE